jgi:hypothetical protein
MECENCSLECELLLCNKCNKYYCSMCILDEACIMCYPFEANTKGLKKGDDVMLIGPGPVYTKATVFKVTSTTKAQIIAHRYVSEYMNPNTIVNTYRNSMMKL